MSDDRRPDGELLFVGLALTPTGWFLVAFALGVRCEPTPGFGGHRPVPQGFSTDGALWRP